MKKVVISILILSGIAISIFFLNDNIKNKHNKTEDKQLQHPIRFSFTFSAWIPSWGSKKGLESLKLTANTLDEISPVWYEVNEDGSLIDKRPNQAEDIEEVAKKNSLKLIPAIAMFDHELFSKVLQDKDNLQRHVESIIREVDRYNYQGVDLDYESTKFEDKNKYFELLSTLSRELHKKDKLLYATVLPKWGDNVIYPSLRETRQVQDWSEIVKYADQIRIMAYDYTYSKSTFPGPIAPITWIQDILDYAIGEVEDRSKIVLGVHLYSYEWFDTVNYLDFQPIMYNNEHETAKTARSYTYDTVLSILQKYDGQVSDFDGEKIYKYQKTLDNNIIEYRTLVFIDEAGVKARTKLAEEYGLGGVVFWRLGGEDRLLNDQ